MAPMGLPCSNDIEMILQAFIEQETQWFYHNPEDKNVNKWIISKAIKNPIIIYEVIEKRDKNGNPIEFSYHEFKQYDVDFIKGPKEIKKDKDVYVEENINN
jgi:hypothetical protein